MRLLLIVFCGLSLYATTYTANSCSQADVQTAINSASNGDTVNVPGPCSPTWGSVVTITGKGITLNGGGATIAASGMLQITTNATASTRVTNFTFTGGGTDNNGDISFAATTTDDTPFRLDDCTFTNSSGAIFVALYGNATGLIDHNTMSVNSASNTAAEMIHNLGLGAGDSAGWSDDIISGSPYMVYIETNTFQGNTGCSSGDKIIETYYGGRNVLRNNTINCANIDQHGTPSSVWTRYYEFYSNQFVLTGSPCMDAITLRGGTGLVYNNTSNNANTTGVCATDVDLWVECGSPGTQCTGGDAYPQLYQIGRGISENLSPLYIWNNTKAGGIQWTVTAEAPQAQLNRDYYTSASLPTLTRCQSAADVTAGCAATPVTYTYTAFVYPYPLTAAGMPNPNGSGVIPSPVAISGMVMGGMVH